MSGVKCGAVPGFFWICSRTAYTMSGMDGVGGSAGGSGMCYVGGGGKREMSGVVPDRPCTLV